MNLIFRNRKGNELRFNMRRPGCWDGDNTLSIVCRAFLLRVLKVPISRTKNPNTLESNDCTMDSDRDLNAEGEAEATVRRTKRNTW